MQRNGCVQVGWYRWQLPAEFGLHSQMENDRKLSPTWIHLPHHPCFEGARLCTKPKTCQLGLIPAVAPKQLHPNTHGRGSVQLQISPQILSVSPPYGAGCCENSQPYGGQQSLLSVWYIHCREFKGTELYSEAHLLSAGKNLLPMCWALQLVLAAEGCPSVQKAKPCSTDSLLHHLLILAITGTSWFRGRWQNRTLAVRGQSWCSNDLYQAMLGAVIPR